MLAKLEEFEQLLERARQGGGDKYIQRHRDRGKLLVRERIELLIDADSPFLELSTLAGWGSDKPLGANVVTGIGVVNGVECVILANDPTSQAGSLNRYSLRKTLRAQDIARENRMPLINLVESGGRTSPTRRRCSSPAGSGSATSPRCRRWASPPSPSSSGAPPPAAPTSPGCATTR
jgi:Acetyl-CoA carboxylase, carboxyltransferase component (subunits alpha and beta)